MAQPVDSSILHEIVRVIGARNKVPERVKIRGKDYSITYLDDHKQRLEEALRRHDPDRLSMLYGQLASKVKYQLIRALSAAAKARSAANKKRGRTLVSAAVKKGHHAVKKRTSTKKTAASHAARS